MKKNGQMYSENILVALMVLGVSIAGISLFGNNISEFFSKQDYPTDASERVRVEADEGNINFISEAKLIDGKKEYKTPIETIVRQNMLEKNYIQTTGPQGNVHETALIMKEYISQLKQIIAQDKSDNEEIKMFFAALNNYDAVINKYLRYNDKIINSGNDPVLKLLNELDMSIDLDADGYAAERLKTALVNLAKTLPEGTLKNLIKLYTSDILNFGKSLEYHIDSRISHNLDNTLVQGLPSGTLPAVGTPGMPDAKIGQKLVNIASMLENAAQNITNEYNEIPKDDDLLMVALAQFLPLQSPDSWDDDDDYWSSERTKKLNGYKESSGSFNDGSLKLENGMALAIDTNNFKLSSTKTSSVNGVTTEVSFNIETTGSIWIDIDGANIGANQIGTDVFGFMIKGDQIVPMGSDESEVTQAAIIASTCASGSTSLFNSGWGCTQAYINNAQPIPDVSNSDIPKEELKEFLQQVAINPELNPVEKEKIAKQIKIYRNGNLQEIAPNSLNTAQLCSNLNASVSNGGCQLRPQQSVLKTQLEKKEKDDVQSVYDAMPDKKYLPPVMPPESMPPQNIKPDPRPMMPPESMPPQRIKKIELVPYTAARPNILKYSD